MNSVSSRNMDTIDLSTLSLIERSLDTYRKIGTIQNELDELRSQQKYLLEKKKEEEKSAEKEAAAGLFSLASLAPASAIAPSSKKPSSNLSPTEEQRGRIVRASVPREQRHHQRERQEEQEEQQRRHSIAHRRPTSRSSCNNPTAASFHPPLYPSSQSFSSLSTSGKIKGNNPIPILTNDAITSAEQQMRRRGDSFWGTEHDCGKTWGDTNKAQAKSSTCNEFASWSTTSTAASISSSPSPAPTAAAATNTTDKAQSGIDERVKQLLRKHYGGDIIVPPPLRKRSLPPTVPEQQEEEEEEMMDFAYSLTPSASAIQSLATTVHRRLDAANSNACNNSGLHGSTACSSISRHRQSKRVRFDLLPSVKIQSYIPVQVPPSPTPTTSPTPAHVYGVLDLDEEEDCNEDHDTELLDDEKEEERVMVRARTVMDQCHHQPGAAAAVVGYGNVTGWRDAKRSLRRVRGMQGRRSDAPSGGGATARRQQQQQRRRKSSTSTCILEKDVLVGGVDSDNGEEEEAAAVANAAALVLAEAAQTPEMVSEIRRTRRRMASMIEMRLGQIMRGTDQAPKGGTSSAATESATTNGKHNDEPNGTSSSSSSAIVLRRPASLASALESRLYDASTTLTEYSDLSTLNERLRSVAVLAGRRIERANRTRQ